VVLQKLVKNYFKMISIRWSQHQSGTGGLKRWLERLVYKVVLSVHRVGVALHCINTLFDVSDRLQMPISRSARATHGQSTHQNDAQCARCRAAPLAAATFWQTYAVAPSSTVLVPARSFLAQKLLS
jgi:hypothetical protein